jgi:hypothetical protein
MKNQFVLKTEELVLALVSEPKTVNSLSELPNWRITLWNKEHDEPQQVMIRLDRRIFSGNPRWKSDTLNQFNAFLKDTLADPDFIKEHGELTYPPKERQFAPTHDSVWSVARELDAYLARRGKNFVTKILPGYEGTKSQPRLELSLRRDVAMRTDSMGRRNYPMQRRTAVMGTVAIREGNEVAFELYHPFLDLRDKITAPNLVKDIEREIESGFPFAKGVWYGWRFLNLERHE